MPQHDIVVIGGSAGGLQALTTIVAALPGTLPASVLVVMHSSGNGPAVLPEILRRISRLPVAFAANGDVLEEGRIYIAQANCHLLVGPEGLVVSQGPRENGFRPAVDPLFRTAAREHGARVIGIILSGALSDGTYGLSMIKHYGGIAVVQEPNDAIIASMPESAIRHVDVDHVLPAAKIAPLIERLMRPGSATKKKKKGSHMPFDDEPDPQLPSDEMEVRDMNDLFGPPSGLTCPDCGGALWEILKAGLDRYRCHVGHQYAAENLEAGQRDAVDNALWSALRVLEEHVDLKTRMSKRAAASELKLVAEGFAEGARDARLQAEQIRALLYSGGNGNGAKRSGNGAKRTKSAKRARTATPARKRTKNASRRGPSR